MNDMLGYVIVILISMGGLITYTYNGLEYKNYPSISSCTGECYEEYKIREGTIAEQLEKKKAAAAGDPFSSVRGLWAGCAACHGQQGQGMGMFPALAGRDSDTIIEKLTIYKNRGEVGNMSSTMWAQAGQLSEQEIETLGKFIQETMNE